MLLHVCVGTSNLSQKSSRFPARRCPNLVISQPSKMQVHAPRSSRSRHYLHVFPRKRRVFVLPYPPRNGKKTNINTSWNEKKRTHRHHGLMDVDDTRCHRAGRMWVDVRNGRVDTGGRGPCHLPTRCKPTSTAWTTCEAAFRLGLPISRPRLAMYTIVVVVTLCMTAPGDERAASAAAARNTSEAALARRGYAWLRPCGPYENGIYRVPGVPGESTPPLMLVSYRWG